MKKKYLYLLIAGLALSALLPVVILMCLCTRSEQIRPQTVMYGGIEYTYKEFLTGCILSSLEMLDEPPDDDDAEGIKAVASALDCSARYLLRAGKTLDGGYPSLEHTDEREGLSHFGAELSTYRKYAEKAAEYAISYDINVGGEAVFLPICRISSGALISPYDSGNPYVKKLYCEKDKAADFYIGSCQLTADGIAEIMLTEYPSLVIPPDESRWISDIRCDNDGNVLRLNVCGIEMSCEQFRRLFGIRSAAFDMSYTQRLYSFTTKGDGCNTGMSVYSALKLSERGYTAEQILDEFYDL